MLPLAKTFFLVALVCPVAVAADCSDEGKCNDETSLVQVKQVVKHGTERIPDPFADLEEPIPGLDGFGPLTGLPGLAESTAMDEGVAHAEPSSRFDAGSVEKAFKETMVRSSHSLEKHTSDDINFHESVRASRDISHDKAAERVRKAKRELKEAVIADREAVHKVARERKHVVEDAIDRVKDSKAIAESHRIKKEQARAAAKLGEHIGEVEGKAASKRAWDYYHDKVREDEAAEHAAKEARRKREHEEDVKAAINRKTKRIEEHNEDWADHVEDRITAAKARSAAMAGMAEERIEGPEGLRNTVDNIKSKWAEAGLMKEAELDQKDTLDAGDGSPEDPADLDDSFPSGE